MTQYIYEPEVRESWREGLREMERGRGGDRKWKERETVSKRGIEREG